jgi:uncharacterized protein with PQ loop repeat
MKFLIYMISSSISLGVAIWLQRSKMKKTVEKESLLVNLFFLINFVMSFGLYALLLQEILCFKQLPNYYQTQLWNIEISILNFNILFLGPFLTLKRMTDPVPFEKIKKSLFWSMLCLYVYWLAKKLNQETLSVLGPKSPTGISSFFVNIFCKEAQFNLLGIRLFFLIY